jgi:3-dehydroquinate dehydratase I
MALCGCLLDVHPSEIAKYLNHPLVDLVEWRLDHTIRRRSLPSTVEMLKVLSSGERRPVIATNRPAREGGVFDGDDGTRIDALWKASEAGAEWIDLEHDVAPDVVKRFESGASRVVLSRHNFSETPDAPTLRRMAERMGGLGASAIKIATYAHALEDNLRVLELIPFARRELGVDAIAFCMGPMGLWSRFSCLVLGSPWTYVQMPGQEASAPGQVSLTEMRAILDAGAWMFRPGETG